VRFTAGVPVSFCAILALVITPAWTRGQAANEDKVRLALQNAPGNLGTQLEEELEQPIKPFDFHEDP
jgi:hypothetical protein